MVKKRKIPPSNLRDYFTSGGRCEIDGIQCHKIIGIFLNCEKEIIETWLNIIEEGLIEKLIKYWEEHELDVKSHLTDTSVDAVLDFWKEYIIRLYKDEECGDILRSYLEKIIGKIKSHNY